MADLKRRNRWPRSWLIPTFVAANVVVFIVAMFVNNCPTRNHLGISGNCVAAKFLGRLSFQPLTENPKYGPSASTLEKLGALSHKVAEDHHQQWRLITSMWLHSGVIHLLENMFILIIVGIRLEQEFGFVRVGSIYILSAFCGSLLSSLFIQPDIISLGASGAFLGLLGAMVSEVITNWSLYSNKAQIMVAIAVTFAVNFAVRVRPGVDNFVSLGGFLTGFLLGFVLLVRPQFGWMDIHVHDHERVVKSKHNVCQYVVSGVALVLLVAGLTTGLAALLGGGGNLYKNCRWCHYCKISRPNIKVYL